MLGRPSKITGLGRFDVIFRQKESQLPKKTLYLHNAILNHTQWSNKLN